MAEAQAQGSDGNGGCTNNWGAAWKIVQLGEDRHQGDGGGPVRKIRWRGGVESKLLDPQATHTFLLSQIPALHTFPRQFFETPRPHLLPQHKNLAFSQGNYL